MSVAGCLLTCLGSPRSLRRRPACPLALVFAHPSTCVSISRSAQEPPAALAQSFHSFALAWPSVPVEPNGHTSIALTAMSRNVPIRAHPESAGVD
jgi:hypothetical protein